MTYETANQEWTKAFADAWAAFDSTWDQDTRIQWPFDEDFSPPDQPWLSVVFEDVEGFNDTVSGVLDTQVALLTVDIYVPLASERPTLLRTLGDQVRTILRSLSTPVNARPGNLFFRSFGTTERGEAHGRVGLELQYTVT